MKYQPFRIVLGAFLLAILAQGVFAQCTSSSTTSPTTAVPTDNSKSNKLDQSHMTATADAHKDNKDDRTLTQRIRKSVMAEKSLSTYAHIVKIVSVNGTVTLKGVVRSDQERRTIEAKAVSVADQDHIVNDLKVTSKSGHSKVLR